MIRVGFARIARPTWLYGHREPRFCSFGLMVRIHTSNLLLALGATQESGQRTPRPGASRRARRQPISNGADQDRGLRNLWGPARVSSPVVLPPARTRTIDLAQAPPGVSTGQRATPPARSYASIFFGRI